MIWTTSALKTGNLQVALTQPKPPKRRTGASGDDGSDNWGFFCLPRETRDAIHRLYYVYNLSSEHGPVCLGSLNRYFDLNLLYASRKVYEEASRILFAENTFGYRYAGGPAFQWTSAGYKHFSVGVFMLSTNDRMKIAWKKIRKFHFHYYACCGHKAKGLSGLPDDYGWRKRFFEFIAEHNPGCSIRIDTHALYYDYVRNAPRYDTRSGYFGGELTSGFCEPMTTYGHARLESSFIRLALDLKALYAVRYELSLEVPVGYVFEDSPLYKCWFKLNTIVSSCAK